MYRLEREIKTLKDRLGQIESNLQLCYTSNDDVTRNQEQIEHRLNNVEETTKDLVKKVEMLREDVVVTGEYLNNAITRINDLHQCLNKLLDKDLKCNEKMCSSDDESDLDDEFDLDDCSERIELEVQRLEKTMPYNNELW